MDTNLCYFTYQGLIAYEETVNCYKLCLAYFKHGVRALGLLEAGDVGSIGDDPADLWPYLRIVMEAMGFEMIEVFNDWFADHLSHPSPLDVQIHVSSAPCQSELLLSLLLLPARE